MFIREERQPRKPHPNPLPDYRAREQSQTKSRPKISDDCYVTKTFAWMLFISSVVCFVLQFRTQQLAVAAERMRAEIEQPTAHNYWQTAEADANEVNGY